MVFSDPPAVYADRIQSAVVSALNDPEIRQRFEEQNLVSVDSKPAEFAKFFAKDHAFYKMLTGKIGVVPQ